MKFTVESGKMRATDPCYQGFRADLQAEFDVLPGKWIATPFLEDYGPGGMGGIRVAAFLVKHEDAPSYISNALFERVNNCGVDSGQFGFFDAAKIPTDEAEYEWVDGSGNFYSLCCEGTTGGNEVAILPFGACSSSGFGDGGYNVEVAKNAEGLVIAARVIYITEEEEFEEENEGGDDGYDETEDEATDDLEEIN